MTKKCHSRSQMNMSGPVVQFMRKLQTRSPQDGRWTYMTAIARRNAVTSSPNPMMESINPMVFMVAPPFWDHGLIWIKPISVIAIKQHLCHLVRLSAVIAKRLAFRRQWKAQERRMCAGGESCHHVDCGTYPAAQTLSVNEYSDFNFPPAIAVSLLSPQRQRPV
jgi:hypothetical protein